MANDLTFHGSPLPLDELKAIAATLRAANPEAATNEIWNDAAVTGTFSLSAGGGNLEGWISYYDGTKVHFALSGISSRVGTAAGTFALPLVRVRPAGGFVGREGTFSLGGFWAGGTLHLAFGGQPITQGDLPVLSAAPWDYQLAGTVKYT